MLRSSIDMRGVLEESESSSCSFTLFFLQEDGGFVLEAISSYIMYYKNKIKHHEKIKAFPHFFINQACFVRCMTPKYLYEEMRLFSLCLLLRNVCMFN